MRTHDPLLVFSSVTAFVPSSLTQRWLPSKATATGVLNP